MNELSRIQTCAKQIHHTVQIIHVAMNTDVVDAGNILQLALQGIDIGVLAVDDSLQLVRLRNFLRNRLQRENRVGTHPSS